MQRKTPDKFLVGKGHLFFYRTAFVILVGESHRVFINRFDAVVADGDFMRVSTQIFNHRLQKVAWHKPPTSLTKVLNELGHNILVIISAVYHKTFPEKPWKALLHQTKTYRLCGCFANCHSCQCPHLEQCSEHEDVISKRGGLIPTCSVCIAQTKYPVD